MVSSSGLFSDRAFGKLKSSNRSHGHISVPTSVSSRNLRYASLKLSHFVYSSHGKICLKVNLISLILIFWKPKKWFHIWRSISNVLFKLCGQIRRKVYLIISLILWKNLKFESKIRPSNRLSSNNPIPDPKTDPIYWLLIPLFISILKVTLIISNILVNIGYKSYNITCRQPS